MVVANAGDHGGGPNMVVAISGDHEGRSYLATANSGDHEGRPSMVVELTKAELTCISLMRAEEQIPRPGAVHQWFPV